MLKTEPGRSRLLIVAGLVLCALGAWMQVLTDDSRQTWAALFDPVWYLLIVILAVFNLVIGLRLLGAASKRPARFVVHGGRFVASGLLSTGLMTLLLLLLLGNSIADSINSWRDVQTGRDSQGWAVLMTALTVPMLLATILLVVLGWRGLRLELTSTGITWQSPILWRTIPWDALTQAGPPRPHLDAAKLELAVQQPALVTQNGWAVHTGPKDRPALSLQLDIHPWFLADAIRWYGEHPEHRDAIGTQQEHDRLTTAGYGAEIPS